MPKVPGNMDPSTLQGMTKGQWEPDPTHMMMAMSDMHQEGRLIQPDDVPSDKPGSTRVLKPRKPRNARKR